jgi:hypothetical protein
LYTLGRAFFHGLNPCSCMSKNHGTDEFCS